MKKFGNKIGSILGNRYLIVTVLAGAWLLFFDSYNFFAQQNVRAQINELKADKVFYQQEIKSIDYAYDRILEDREELERYAREEYHMHRSNEDVFVLTEE